jgi:hypothetical protein
MNIQARKLNFIQEVLSINNTHLFSMLENTLEIGKKKIQKKEFTPMSMQTFYDMIDKSVDDYKNGRVTSHEALKKEINEWL